MPKIPKEKSAAALGNNKLNKFKIILTQVHVFSIKKCKLTRSVSDPDSDPGA